MRMGRGIDYLYGGALLFWTFAGLDGALSGYVDLGVMRAFAVAGAALLILAFIAKLVGPMLEDGALETSFEASHVKRKELEDVRSLSADFITQVPSLAHLQAIYDAGRCCVWFVEKKSGRWGERSKKIGFFSLIRLTDQAIGLLSTNSIDAFRFDRSHIAGPKKKSKALYVGGLGAHGLRGKGWLVQHMRGRISQFFSEGGEVVFTRPVTEDGLRIAKKLKFVPAVSGQDGLGNIYRLDGD